MTATPLPRPAVWPHGFIGANSIHFVNYLAYGWSIEQTVKDARASGIGTLRVYLDASLEVPGWEYVERLQPLGRSIDKRLEVWDRVLEAASKNDVRILAVFTDLAAIGWPPPDDRRIYLEKMPFADIQDARARDGYKAWVEKIVLRKNTVNGKVYRDDPTIIAWELANEPALAYLGQTCPEFGRWIGDMSAYVKALDPSRPVTVGFEFTKLMPNPVSTKRGEVDLPGRDDCLRLLAAPGIDFISFHYNRQIASSWQPFPVIIRSLMSLGKPVVVEEFSLDFQRPVPITDEYVAAFKQYMDQGYCAGLSAFIFWGWDTTEARRWQPADQLRQRPHWLGEGHDVEDANFVDLMKTYKVPEGPC